MPFCICSYTGNTLEVRPNDLEAQSSNITLNHDSIGTMVIDGGATAQLNYDTIGTLFNYGTYTNNHSIIGQVV
jgi:hypothetical protein